MDAFFCFFALMGMIGTKKGGRSLLFSSWVQLNLLHDELHGVLKAVGLHSDKVDASGQVAGADARAVDTRIDVHVLVHDLLTHDVVNADAHF